MKEVKKGAHRLKYLSWFLVLFVLLVIVIWICYSSYRKHVIINLPTYKTEWGDVFAYEQIDDPAFLSDGDCFIIYYDNVEITRFDVEREIADENPFPFSFTTRYSSDTLSVSEINIEKTYEESESIKNDYLIKRNGQYICTINSSDFNQSQQQILTNAILELDDIGYIDWPSEFFIALLDNEIIMQDIDIRKRLYEILNGDLLNTNSKLLIDGELTEMTEAEREKLLGEIKRYTKTLLQ